MSPQRHLYPFSSVQFSSVQSISHVWLFATPWTAAHLASLSITNSWSLPKLMSIESAMPSNHLILCRPLSFCLQSFPVSGSFQMSQLFASDGQSIGVSTRVTGLSSWNSILSMSLPYLGVFSVLFQSFMPLQLLQVFFFLLEFYLKYFLLPSWLPV